MSDKDIEQTLEFYREKEFVLEEDPFDEGVYLLAQQGKDDVNGRMVIRCVSENLKQLKELLESEGF